MRRSRAPSLRGSVRQNNPVRARSRQEASWGTVIFRLGLLMGSLGLLTLLGIWLWHIGWPQKQVGRIADAGLHLTQKAKFSVKDIVVEGRQQTSKDAIATALGTSSGAPILTFDPDAAQSRIAKLPWVRSATVERILPDKIVVHLTERTPMARWQHDGHTVVIDHEGKELPDATSTQFAGLPLVVGSDAPEETDKLLTLLKNYPTVEKPMTAAVRVGERRWDLHLEPNIIVRLPESDVDTALERLAQLIDEKKVLDRNVIAIDLRFRDRLILEPAPATTAKPAASKL